MSDVYTKSGSVTSGAVFGVDATTKVRFVAQDYFTSVVVEKEVGPTFTLMNFGADGKSLAIGRLSSNMGTFQNALAQTHAHATTASPSGGYLKILQLKIAASAWNYGGIEFKYHCGAKANSFFDTGKIVINGGNTTDPAPAIVLCSNPDNPIYLHNFSTPAKSLSTAATPRTPLPPLSCVPILIIRFICTKHRRTHGMSM